MGNQIPEVKARDRLLKIQHLPDQIFHEARDIYTRWPNLSLEEKRGMVEHITERITVTNNAVTITLSYLPSQF